MTQLLGHRNIVSLRLGLEASSTIALRARALRREVSQWVAVQERGEFRSVEFSAHRASKTRGKAFRPSNSSRGLVAAEDTKLPSCSISGRSARPKINGHQGSGSPLRPDASPKRVCCTNGRQWLKWASASRSALAQLPEALANHSLNRTFCCVRPLAIISFLAKVQPPQNAG